MTLTENLLDKQGRHYKLCVIKIPEMLFVCELVFMNKLRILEHWIYVVDGSPPGEMSEPFLHEGLALCTEASWTMWSG